MYLAEIAVASDKRIDHRIGPDFARRFDIQTTCIEELYRSLTWRQIRTEDLAKVMFYFTDEIDSPPEKVAPMRCYWPFDFGRYRSVDAETKKRMILDTLQEAILWLAGKLGWDTGPLHAAYDEAVRRNLTLEGLLRKSWASPDRKYRMRVHYRFDLDAVYLEAVLFRNRSKREIARKPLGTGEPYPGCMTEYSAEGVWTSPTSFELRSSDFLQQVWKVDFSEELG